VHIGGFGEHSQVIWVGGEDVITVGRQADHGGVNGIGLAASALRAGQA
jgi:hypothetical protein